MTHCISRQVRALAALCGIALVTGFAAPACAGTFSVSPVRIFMQARERATAITIVNEGATELVMQADLFTWAQDQDGADKLEPTEDLVLAPPILKLAPGGRQVVRLASLRPPPTGQQQTYRLIVREIPEAQQQSPGVNVQVALAFSLPVFITPPDARAALACTARRGPAAAATIDCENRGQAYAQPVGMELEPAGGPPVVLKDIRGGYILPAARRSFEVPSGSALRAGPLKLTLTLDDGSKQSFDVRLGE